MATADELRAQLEVAELEEELAKAKTTKKGADRELKLKVREARKNYRENFRDTAGMATPDAINGKANL